jgi:hypothetical protein
VTLKYVCVPCDATSSDYFAKQHQPVGFRNGDAVLCTSACGVLVCFQYNWWPEVSSFRQVSTFFSRDMGQHLHFKLLTA